MHRKPINKLFIATMMFCLVKAGFALQMEHRLWEKLPLKIELPLNQERLIEFPSDIKILDKKLTGKLEILKIKNRLYLKALEPFKAARLIIQLLSEEEVIILDLNAGESFKNKTPIAIVSEETTTQENKTIKNDYDYNAIQLTRFAIQALFSPLRLQTHLEGIHRIPLPTDKTIALFNSDKLNAYPIASWRSKNLYITAVELKNNGSKPIDLSFKKLKGLWQTASFYPSQYLPPNNKRQNTVVFLVSSQPFTQALNQEEGFAHES